MYCRKCGKEIGEINVCPFCGEDNSVIINANYSDDNNKNNSINNLSYNKKRGYDPNQGVLIAAKVFLVIGMVAQGIFIIPLLWVLPIGILSWKKIDNAYSSKELIGFGVASLLLVNQIGGILMLCARDN